MRLYFVVYINSHFRRRIDNAIRFIQTNTRGYDNNAKKKHYYFVFLINPTEKKALKRVYVLRRYLKR